MHYRPIAGTAYTSMPARKGRQENTEKPLCTANPKAAQRPSSTGPRDEKESWEALWLAWKCTEVVTATLPGIIPRLAGNKSHCPGEGSAGRGGPGAGRGRPELLGLMLHQGFNKSLSSPTASVPPLSNGARPVLSATRVVLGRFNWGHSNETMYMKML